MSEFSEQQVAAMAPLNAELQEIATRWQKHMALPLAMSINWSSFWQDTTRTQQATQEALRFMVDCGSRRLLNCYTVSPHNAFFNRNKEILKKLSGYQLIWVTNPDDVRLEVSNGILMDYFHIERFVQYYANLDPFFETLLQNQLGHSLDSKELDNG